MKIFEKFDDFRIEFITDLDDRGYPKTENLVSMIIHLEERIKKLEKDSHTHPYVRI